MTSENFRKKLPLLKEDINKENTKMREPISFYEQENHARVFTFNFKYTIVLSVYLYQKFVKPFSTD